MKRLRLVGIIVLVLIVVVYIFIGRPLLTVLNGYAAKNMCSCLFVANIPEETARNVDLAFFPMNYSDPEIDYENKIVVSSLFGITKTAVFREGLGCALINEISVEEATQRVLDLTSLSYHDSLANWFDKIDTIEYLDNQQLSQIDQTINRYFDETDPKKPLNTRAIVILHKGQLVGEAYADGFNENSKLLGWSMTKSLTSTMYGVLRKKELFELNNSLPIDSWKDTPKEKITYQNMFQASSGLNWTEFYFGSTDITRMLFDSDNMGLMASNSKLGKEPGQEWKYSSGTTNILSYALKSYFNSDEKYLKFPYEEIFYRIGMYSMILEPDASGTFVGSSYSWATAKDWAKIGQLYLNNGRWGNEQIVPESWVTFVKTAAPASEGVYGGQFWLNLTNRFPDIPSDAFYFGGFHNQYVMIIPSKDLVVVRLGVTYAENFDLNGLVSEIIEITE